MKISQYPNNTGLFNSGSLFLTAETGPISGNHAIYAKDILSGLFNISTPFGGASGIQLNHLSNDMFMRTQMGAEGLSKHANLSALDSFRTKLAGTGLINIIYIGDGYVALGLQDQVKNDLQINFGTGGFGNMEYPYIFNDAAANTSYQSSLSVLQSTYLRDHYALTTGSNSIISYYSTGPTTRFQWDTANIYYVANTGAGNFTLSTGILFGGSYTNYSGVNANFGSAQCRVATIRMGSPGFYQMRISGSGDLSFLRIPHIQFFNSTASSGRVNFHSCTQGGGPSYASAFSSTPGSIKDGIRDMVFSGTNPDLIVFNASMGNPPIASAEISGMNSCFDNLKLKWPQADVIVCGIFPNSDTTDNSEQNEIMKIAALRRGYAYFDGFNPFINRSTWNSRGFTDGAGGSHFSSTGQYVYGKLLWNWLKL